MKQLHDISFIVLLFTIFILALSVFIPPFPTNIIRINGVVMIVSVIVTVFTEKKLYHIHDNSASSQTDSSKKLSK